MRGLFRAVCLLLILASVGAAEAPAFAQEPDDDWALEERDLQARSGYQDFDLTSSRNSTLGEDVWRLVFDARAATMRFDVQGSRPEMGASGLQVQLGSLIEFQDLDGDGRLGLGDPVVQRIGLASGNPSVWVETVSQEPGRTFIVHYWANGATFDVTVHALANGTRGGGGTPTSNAFDLQVHSFPYLTNNRTFVAVELRLEGNLAVAGDALATPNGTLRSFLAWGQPLDGLGNASHLGLTLQRYLGAPDPQWLLVLSQPRGNLTPLPMNLGVARVAPEPSVIPKILEDISGDWRIYVAGLMVAGGLVGWPVYKRLHDRRQKELALERRELHP